MAKFSHQLARNSRLKPSLLESGNTFYTKCKIFLCVISLNTVSPPKSYFSKKIPSFFVDAYIPLRVWFIFNFLN